MNRARSSQPAKPQGLFALLWAMVARMAAMLVSPDANRSFEALWAEMEATLVKALFQMAQTIDPDLADLDFDDFDIRLRWTKSGFLDFHMAVKPHAIARAKQAYREHLAYLRKVRLAIMRRARIAVIRGVCRINRRVQIIIGCELRRRRRRHRPASHLRARAPARVAPLTLVPP